MLRYHPKSIILPKQQSEGRWPMVAALDGRLYSDYQVSKERAVDKGAVCLFLCLVWVVLDL
jgi:hypothetical protein